MPENCPICKAVLPEKKYTEGYDCPRCGRFAMSDSLKFLLPRLYDMEREKTDVEKTAILSHTIRKMAKEAMGQPVWPVIDSQFIEATLKNPLPSLIEQANNLIIWFAENVPPGESYFVQPLMYQSIIGAKSPGCLSLTLKYLLDKGFLEGEMAETSGVLGRADVTLSFDGWQYYDQLNRGAIDSRKAFMAMEYGNKELDRIVDVHFKPAVADTGFELYRLDENPKAGLIDDRLRVEIRNSRFLISDLTHENSGAYWEAGYAEGLGKPVIYTCEKEKFDSDKPHFDTNHHLIVIWDENEIQKAVESLKATIRATLPDEAKLSDD